jgi:glutaredoxin
MNRPYKILIGFILFFVLFFAKTVCAADFVNIYLFYGDGCPHCADEERYLFGELKNKYPDIRIYTFEIYNNANNALLLQKVADELGVGVDGVPFLVVGNKNFVGFADGTTSRQIEIMVEKCLSGNCKDSVAPIVGVDSPESSQTTSDVGGETGDNTEKIVKIPFLGEINAINFSLPLLTIIMGALDGFNPCAMWTLLFLISLLLGMENRKRMWILGTAFIVASASVYFLFMSAWLNLILFLGFVIWIRVLIGVFALAGGCYSIKEFIFNKDGGCKVAGDEKRRKIFERLKLSVQQNSLWFALGGIFVLAFAVNLVELICSAGLPAIYTQILALNEMAGWRYYFYILLYIFFFMLDDLFIFFVAMITLEMSGITTKYAKASRLIGGIVMLAIGLMLIFKPEWLMFG